MSYNSFDLTASMHRNMSSDAADDRARMSVGENKLGITA